MTHHSMTHGSSGSTAALRLGSSSRDRSRLMTHHSMTHGSSGSTTFYWEVGFGRRKFEEVEGTRGNIQVVTWGVSPPLDSISGLKNRGDLNR